MAAKKKDQVKKNQKAKNAQKPQKGFFSSISTPGFVKKAPYVYDVLSTGAEEGFRNGVGALALGGMVSGVRHFLSQADLDKTIFGIVGSNIWKGITGSTSQITSLLRIGGYNIIPYLALAYISIPFIKIIGRTISNGTAGYENVKKKLLEFIPPGIAAGVYIGSRWLNLSIPMTILSTVGVSMGILSGLFWFKDSAEQKALKESREQAAQEKAASDKAAKEKAAKEKVATEKAAAKEKAAKEKAAKKKAAAKKISSSKKLSPKKREANKALLNLFARHREKTAKKTTPELELETKKRKNAEFLKRIISNSKKRKP